MSELLHIIEMLQDTQKEMSNAETAMAQYGPSFSLAISMDSLLKRREELEAVFEDLTNQSYVDVCSYRLFAGTEQRPTLPAIASAWGAFQSLYTLLYDAMRGERRIRNRPSAEAIAATTFGFAYTYAGSVGVVLTLPNDHLLFGETALDAAMELLFTLAVAESSEQIAAMAEKLGPAPIQLLYEWAQDHVQAGLGADITWRRGEKVRASLFVEADRLENLQQVIAETSDEKEEEISVVGHLVGADIQRHTFHLQLGDEGEIRGRMSDEIGHEYVVQLPRSYRARVRQTSKVSYATGEVDISYYLVSLEAPG